MDESEEHSCCRKLSTKIFLTMLSLGFLFAITSFCVLTALSINQPDDFCTSAQCLKSAAQILDFLDRSQNPCDNLKEFACEKLSRSPQPQERPPNLDSFITEPESKDDLPVVAMQKRFFRACMDVEAMDNNNDHTFLDLIKDLVEWPILERNRWKVNHFNWLEAMKRAINLGLPFQWFLAINLEDTHLKVSMPSLATQNIQTRDYRFLMMDITANLIGTKYINGSLPSELIDVDHFSRELQKIIKKAHPSITVLGTLNDLTLLPPRMRFRNFFKVTGRLLDDNTPILFDIQNYLTKLDNLLTKTHISTQVNYIVWKIVEYFAPFLSRDIRQSYESYFKRTTNTTFSRFQFCLDDTKARFWYVSEYAFIQSRATEEVRSKMSEIVAFLKESAVSMLTNAEVPQETKDYYTELVEKLTVDAGGQDEMFDEHFLRTYLYLEGSFSSGNIIDMITERNRMHTKFMFELIGAKHRKQIYYQDNIASDISVFQDDTRIVVPATLLQTSTFSTELPNYLNYAGLGVSIGKEMSSLFNTSFDEEFLLYFESCQEGKDNDTIAIRNKYEHTFGIDLSYQAYINWASKNNPEANLPGYLYKPKQLFWIKTTMDVCEKDSILDIMTGLENFGNDFMCVSKPQDQCSYF